MLVGGAAAGCGGESRAAEEGLRFVDVAAEAGIDVVQVSGDPRRWYIPESNGCGAAWLDHDGDGDFDLFVANGAELRYLEDGARLEVVRSASSRLYRNDGGMRFTDVTDEAGARRSDWAQAVTVGDVDGDGDPDLHLACFGDDVLLQNDGGRFTDVTRESGVSNPLWGTGAAFADPDLDGDLDLFVANYVLFDLEAPPDGGRRAIVEGVEVGWGPIGENGRFNPGAPNLYLRGDGTGRFEVATAEAGLALEEPFCSFAPVFVDVDLDGLPDLLVANDMQPSSLFHNKGGGRFVEEGVARGFATDGSGNPTAAMGLAVADVDGDGDFDVLRTNFDMEPNSLHLNDGRGYFREVGAPAGLAGPSLDRLGWGCAFFDADLDGDLDLVVANGHVYPQAEEIGMHPWAMTSQIFVADRAGPLGIRWRDATAEVGGALAVPRSARGLALGDPDDDGDLDVLLTDVDHAPRLLENRSARKGRWISVRLTGTTSNRDGLGALVRVTAGGRTWTSERRSGGGLYSSHDPRLHFGLGPVGRIERIEVRWPSGSVQVLESPPLDRVLDVVEPSTEEAAR